MRVKLDATISFRFYVHEARARYSNGSDLLGRVASPIRPREPSLSARLRLELQRACGRLWHSDYVALGLISNAEDDDPADADSAHTRLRRRERRQKSA